MIDLRWAKYQIMTPEIELVQNSQNSGGPKSGAGTPYSVSDFISNNTDELLREAATQGFGKRRQNVLKALVPQTHGSGWRGTDPITHDSSLGI
jgi:hypothetical protein